MARHRKVRWTKVGVLALGALGMYLVIESASPSNPVVAVVGIGVAIVATVVYGRLDRERPHR